MPVIDGKYYDTDDTSWWDDLIDKLSPKQPPPGAPQYKLIQAQDAARNKASSKR